MAIAARCECRDSNDTSSFLVQIDSSDRFSGKDQPNVRGRILSESGQMIQGLLDEPTLMLFASCILDGELTTRKSSRSSVPWPCVLDITVYGPLDIFDEIGSWLQEYDVYLQDPQVCHLDVRYCNPHRMSSDDVDSCPLLSEIVSQISGLIHLDDITERPDLLEILSSRINLEESQQPTAVRTALKR